MGWYVPRFQWSPGSETDTHCGVSRFGAGAVGPVDPPPGHCGAREGDAEVGESEPGAQTGRPNLTQGVDAEHQQWVRGQPAVPHATSCPALDAVKPPPHAHRRADRGSGWGRGPRHSSEAACGRLRSAVLPQEAGGPHGPGRLGLESPT